MTRMRTIIATAFALLPIALVVPSTAHAETRVALVVGNAAYQAGALNTPANDAGLIAQTLQAAGFDVVGARDLDQDFAAPRLSRFSGQGHELRAGYGRLRLSQRIRGAARR